MSLLGACSFSVSFASLVCTDLGTVKNVSVVSGTYRIIPTCQSLPAATGLQAQAGSILWLKLCDTRVGWVLFSFFFNKYIYIYCWVVLSTVPCPLVVSWVGLHQPHCPALPPVSVPSGSLPLVRQCTAPLPFVHATGNTSPSRLSNFKLQEDL